MFNSLRYEIINLLISFIMFPINLLLTLGIYSTEADENMTEFILKVIIQGTILMCALICFMIALRVKDFKNGKYTLIPNGTALAMNNIKGLCVIGIITDIIVAACSVYMLGFGIDETNGTPGTLKYLSACIIIACMPMIVIKTRRYVCSTVVNTSSINVTLPSAPLNATSG